MNRGLKRAAIRIPTTGVGVAGVSPMNRGLKPTYQYRFDPRVRRGCRSFPDE